MHTVLRPPKICRVVLNSLYCTFVTMMPSGLEPVASQPKWQHENNQKWHSYNLNLTHLQRNKLLSFKLTQTHIAANTINYSKQTQARKLKVQVVN